MQQVTESERAAIAQVDKALAELRAAVKALVQSRHREASDER
jgi:hypothetical protein